MSDPKRHSSSSDTLRIPIPEEIRRAMLEASAGPDRVSCPACKGHVCGTCAGLGEVDTAVAQEWIERHAETIPAPTETAMAVDDPEGGSDE